MAGSAEKAKDQPARTALALHPFVQPHRVLEASEDDVTTVREEESLARRQLPHHVRDEHPPWLGVSRDSGCQLDRRAEQVALFRHGLSGVESDAYTDGRLRMGFVMGRESPLHRQ